MKQAIVIIGIGELALKNQQFSHAIAIISNYIIITYYPLF